MLVPYTDTGRLEGCRLGGNLQFHFRRVRFMVLLDTQVKTTRPGEKDLGAICAEMVFQTMGLRKTCVLEVTGVS